MTNSSQETLHPWEIAPQEVADMLQSKADFFFMDCRTQEEHETAHVQGATLIPMIDLSMHMSTLRENEDKLIVVMCRSGKRSLNVTAALREQGFANVKSMAGGILRWSRDIDPSVPQY